MNLAACFTGLAIRLQLGIIDCLAGHLLDCALHFLRRSVTMMSSSKTKRKPLNGRRAREGVGSVFLWFIQKPHAESDLVEAIVEWAVAAPPDSQASEPGKAQFDNRELPIRGGLMDSCERRRTTRLSDPYHCLPDHDVTGIFVLSYRCGFNLIPGLDDSCLPENGVFIRFPPYRHVAIPGFIPKRKKLLLHYRNDIVGFCHGNTRLTRHALAGRIAPPRRRPPSFSQPAGASPKPLAQRKTTL